MKSLALTTGCCCSGVIGGGFTSGCFLTCKVIYPINTPTVISTGIKSDDDFFDGISDLIIGSDNYYKYKLI